MNRSGNSDLGLLFCETGATRQWTIKEDATTLFDLENDPHETTDLSAERPDIVAEGSRILDEWLTERLDEAAHGRNGGNPDSPEAVTDPLWTVVAEGGPLHTTRSFDVDAYCERLRETGRERHVETIRSRYD